MEKKRTEDIIRSYLAGEESPEGEALFNQWYASFQDEDTLDMSEQGKAALRQRMLREIKKSVPATASASPVYHDHPPRLRRRSLAPYRTAAALVACLTLALVGWWYYQYVSRTAALVTGNTEIREVVLPDGSTATLNANSVLRYNPDWGGAGPRQVWLEGEAFFSVKHTPNHQPFMVHTPGLNVDVLGTKFNVRHRRHQTTVVLSEGKVRAHVPSSSEQVVMQPGDQVQHQEGQPTLSQHRVDVMQHTAWRSQEVVLNNTSLREIATLLEDYYGLEVVLADGSLGDLRVSSTQALSLQNPEVLLAALSEIFSLKATLTQKRVYFGPR